MSDDKIRNHFRQELEETKKAERDIELAANIEKMKPLVKLLNALNEELGEIEGLAIHPYTNGEAVMIVSKSDHDHIHCYIKPGDSSIYSYYESGLGPDYEFMALSDSVDEIMAKVIDRVGKHIFALQVRSEG
jgi:hypothetical protein